MVVAGVIVVEERSMKYRVARKTHVLNPTAVDFVMFVPLACCRFTVHAIIREDLKMYPRNMWGLLGLHQCLEKAGKGSDPEVRVVCPKMHRRTRS